MQLNTKSPCISVCKMISGICIGCGRTAMEISEWSTMSQVHRHSTNLRAAERLQLQATNYNKDTK